MARRKKGLEERIAGIIRHTFFYVPGMERRLNADIAAHEITRLVNERLTQARAEAWEQGYEAGVRDEHSYAGGPNTPNPYREQA